MGKRVDPEDQLQSKSFKEMGMINKPQEGFKIHKPDDPIKRDLLFRGALTKSGHFCPHETATLAAEIGPLEYQHVGTKKIPSLKERAEMSLKSPPHPNDKKKFNGSKSTWTKANRFQKKDVSTASPGPVYAPFTESQSHMRRVNTAHLGRPDKSKIVVNRGVMGKMVVKPRNRDRAYFLNTTMLKDGTMVKLEDASEIANVGHYFANEDMYKKIKPAVAGMGLAQRFKVKLNLDTGAPGPKYDPSFKTLSQTRSVLAARFGSGRDKKIDRSKAISTGMIKDGVMLNQTSGNTNDVGPSRYCPPRLFDNVKKSIDYGFGQAQMEWMAKQKKAKAAAAKKKRLAKKKKKLKAEGKVNAVTPKKKKKKKAEAKKTATPKSGTGAPATKGEEGKK